MKRKVRGSPRPLAENLLLLLTSNCRNADREEQLQVQPSLETVKPLLSSFAEIPNPPNLVPLCTSVPADILTPSLAYLKVSAR